MRTRLPPFLAFLVFAVAASSAMAVPVSGGPGLEVLASPTRVVLGRDKTVSLQVRVPPETGGLRVAASSGHFAEERLAHGAVRTFQWTPPPVRHPLVAVFLFWVEAADGPPEVTVLRLALLGQTTLDVATSPGASVTVLVGETHFGPVQADGKGKARVPLEVPPGVASARVLATRGELRTDASAPLDVPRVSPHVAALTPAPLPARGGWLLVAGEGPLDVARLKLHVDGGRAEPIEVGDIARFRVTPEEDAASVTAVVQADGAGDDVRAHAEVFRVVVVTKPPAAKPPPALVGDAPWRPAVQVLAGGVFARGDNSGPFGALGVAFTTPWWERRLAGELEVGVRAASFRGTVGALGAVRSQVFAVPVLVSARVELLRGAALSLYGRAGGGVAPFRHRLQTDFPAEVKESKLSGMGLLAIQGAYRFGRWSALGELRGAWAPASTPWLDAQLGGVSALLGMRFEP